MQPAKRLAFAALLCLGLPVSAGAYVQTGTAEEIVESMAGLRQGGAVEGKLDAEAGALRARTLQEEALSFGIRAGMAWRYGQIEQSLASVESDLNTIFSFQQVMVDGRLLLPIVSRIDSAFKYRDRVATETSVGYRIEHPPRLVAVPPSWRSFLIKKFSMPEQPHRILLPKNDEEATVWDENVRKGWAQGVIRAETMFDASTSLLSRSLRGMILFKKLALAGMVENPRLVKDGPGIRVADNSLDVGVVITKIVSDGRFTKPAEWEPMSEDEQRVAYPR